jgi:uncharacterized protein YqgC (DUF456 family)
MDVAWAVLLLAGLVLLWMTNLFGLPGNWLIVAATAGYVWYLPGDSPLGISWWVVGILFALAVGGEIIELIAGAMGAKRQGGSVRGAILALVGSLVGGVIGLFVGIPIPIIGSIIAALVFAGLGALAGAMVGELWKGRNLSGSWEIGKAAFWGRIFGTLAKTLVGAVMIAVTAVAIFVAWLL